VTPPALDIAIQMFNANDLGTILYQAGVRDLPKSKDGKVKLWTQLIGDATRIKAALAGLPERPRRALELLQRFDGEIRTRRFRDLLTRAGIIETKKENPAEPWAQNDVRRGIDPNPANFEQLLAHLLRSGLIWTYGLPDGLPPTARIGFEGGRYVYIPREIADHLPPVPPAKTKPAIAVDHVLSGSARTCQRDLYLVWSAGRDAAFNTTSADFLRMADLKRVAGQLLVAETIATGTRESDYRRIFFLRRLLTALGLLRVEATGAVVGVPDPPFLTAPPIERVRQSFQIWRDGSWWNELWRTTIEGGTRASGRISDYAPPKVGAARRTVLETLAHLSADQEKMQGTPCPWIALELFSDYLHDRDEEFLVDRETAERMAGGYYDRWSYTTYSPYQYNTLGWVWDAFARSAEKGWEGVERLFIETVLTEGLFWLGLVDLGYARPVTPQGGAVPAGLLAVRLTDMGCWLLAGGPQPAVPEETGRVVVQPNFRIFAFDPISDGVLARLDSFATRLNAERAVEYELSRESLYRAQLAGQSVTGIRTWLEQVTGAALPQNVSRSLDEWQAAFERIVVHPRVGWLEVASPDLADAVLAHPTLAAAVIKRASPTGLIVQIDRVDALERALLAAGELPARSRAADQARRGSILLSEDGTLRFTHAVPSLHVLGALRPFCDPAAPDQPAERWRISAAGVARARSAGIDANAILATLDEMAVGGVPDALAARIKAWSRHYGSASLLAVTLIQFRDQAALDELLQDGELARYLRPFKPEARLGLAVVEPAHVKRARDLLAERGVEVS
jgi:hypothetical protein